MIEFEVTLYKSINDDKFEEKEWVLMIESVIIYIRSNRFLMKIYSNIWYYILRKIRKENEIFSQVLK